MEFYRERPFTREDFKDFMFAQSKPKIEMINLVSGLKGKYRSRTRPSAMKAVN